MNDKKIFLSKLSLEERLQERILKKLEDWKIPAEMSGLMMPESEDSNTYSRGWRDCLNEVIKQLASLMHVSEEEKCVELTPEKLVSNDEFNRFQYLAEKGFKNWSAQELQEFYHIGSKLKAILKKLDSIL